MIWRRIHYSSISVALIVALAAGCATGDGGDTVGFEATLAGESVLESGPSKPIALHHEEVTVLSLTMTNNSDQPVNVAHVRIEGEMLDMIFLTYDTGIDLTLQPGEERAVAFPIDFFDLKGQSHGLMRARLRLFDDERTALGSQDLVVDARGSPFATMAVLNLVLAAVGLITFGWNLRHLARRTLPTSRISRGGRFASPGVVLGLAIAAACSTLRIWPRGTAEWIVVTVAGGTAGFLVGYLTPGSHGLADGIIDLTADDEPAIGRARH